MDNQEVVLRATTGTTINIGYECAFADGSKKTVTIGSYSQDSPPDKEELITNIKALNTSISGGSATTFTDNFLSAGGSTCTGIAGCTITVKNTNVIIG